MSGLDADNTGNKDSVNRSRVVSVTGDDPIVVEIITVNYFGSVEIHGYDVSRMIPFGRPARRFGIIYVSAQLVNMVDNSSLDLQNVCCSGISRTEDECGKARGSTLCIALGLEPTWHKNRWILQ
ncbi:hypothetical protein DKX38_028905 [Salix brachista]|uniref:Uncharacterized protein n=1 Tax=Salix brachista TaxID=2182728 RepID=A0A5N5JA35_9ROSI|nr:hypothetical protein DKX38_028905 [Salix brachista]